MVMSSMTKLTTSIFMKTSSVSLKSLKPRRWFRKLCHFYKILNERSPFDLIPNLNRVHETRDSNNIPVIQARRIYFKNSFFPSTISELNKLDYLKI